MPSKRIPRARRHAGDALEAKTPAACEDGAASVATIALARELAAKWRRGRSAAARSASAVPAPEFVALSLPTPASNAPKPAASQDIRVAIERGSTTISVDWPLAAADACAAWLRELLR